ncbi:MAG TPA: hypothetical protein VFB27_14410 [Opitutaceae bacterium]|nr:hypothetical protein [Opitutaceae bacterium]
MARCEAEPAAIPAAPTSVQPIVLQNPPWWLDELDSFVDRLPSFMARNLPGLQPHGFYRIYVRPRVADLWSRNFFRMPVGGEYKVNDRVELSGEVQDYFTTGLKRAEGYGFSGLNLGAKYEQPWPARPDIGVGWGLNFHTPLSRPPPDLTDGYRHTQPYAAATFPLSPGWKLIGYSSVGFDLLNHTALPSNFGKNELHANSFQVSVGAGRDWPHFHASLTLSVASTLLLSDEGRQVLALRPEIVFPFRIRQNSGVVALFTVGTYAIEGPDGTQLGVSSSLRIEFRNRR